MKPKLLKYYDEISQGYNRLYKDEQLAKLQIILEHINPGKNDSLLDVGCGTAFAANLLRCGYVGVDLSFGMLDKAERVMSLVQGNAEKLPFRKGAFDFVISLTALHNVENPDIALDEIGRVGKAHFAFSILQKSSRFIRIDTAIRQRFEVKNEIDAGIDKI